MASASYYRNRKRQYINCLNNVTETANSLQMAINLLEKIIDVQRRSYSIDDVGGGSNYLSHLLEKERKIYSNIVNTIIPNTRSIIRNLEYQIADAEAHEAMES